MRILIAEDDMTSRQFLRKYLSKYGECDIVVDGMEALDAYMISLKDDKPYDLICLDIMMPKVDGVKVLKNIRDMENQKKIPDDKKAKIIMTTALAETRFVQQAYEFGCNAYAAKPIDLVKFDDLLKNLGLI